MINLIQSATTTIHRAGLWFQIRALETTIDGQGKALRLVDCPISAYKIEIARSQARQALARVRAEYNATLPVGVRKTWGMA